MIDTEQGSGRFRLADGIAFEAWQDAGDYYVQIGEKAKADDEGYLPLRLATMSADGQMEASADAILVAEWYLRDLRLARASDAVRAVQAAREASNCPAGSDAESKLPARKLVEDEDRAQKPPSLPIQNADSCVAPTNENTTLADLAERAMMKAASATMASATSSEATRRREGSKESSKAAGSKAHGEDDLDGKSGASCHGSTAPRVPTDLGCFVVQAASGGAALHDGGALPCSIIVPSTANGLPVTMLNVSDSGIESLDVADCEHLYTLLCTDNDLTQLDLSRNTKLAFVDCRNNRIERIDVTSCPNVKLNCDPDVTVTGLSSEEKPEGPVLRR